MLLLTTFIASARHVLLALALRTVLHATPLTQATIRPEPPLDGPQTMNPRDRRSHILGSAQGRKCLLERHAVRLSPGEKLELPIEDVEPDPFGAGLLDEGMERAELVRQLSTSEA